MTRSNIQTALDTLNAMEAEGEFGYRRAETIRQALLAALAVNRRQRPRVLVDVDGVVADFTGATLPHINRILGTSHGPDAVTGYRFSQVFDMNADQVTALHLAWGVPGFCQRIAPFTGAAAGVQQLAQISDVYAVTMPLSALETWTAERDRWLWTHLEIPQNRVIHAHGTAKAIVSGDVLIEDNGDNLAAWLLANPDGIGILWSRPYNQDVDVGLRVSTWAEVIDLVKLTLDYVAPAPAPIVAPA